MRSESKHIRTVTWAALVINLLLAGVKMAVGIIGASQAVIADAVHSLSDMSTDIAILFGVKYWTAPADEEHPYGHARIETIITLGIGIALAVVAISLTYRAVNTMREVHIRQPMLIALIGPAASIVLKEITYRWTVTVGRRVKSPSLIANAWHHRSDALSSIPALIAVVLAVINPKWAFVDHVGAIIVSVFILKVAWDILKPAFHELADRGMTEDKLEEIRQLVLSIDGVESLHALRSRKMSSVYYIDLHIWVEGNLTVEQGHMISKQVKMEVMAHASDIADVLVHIEPKAR